MEEGKGRTVGEGGATAREPIKGSGEGRRTKAAGAASVATLSPLSKPGTESDSSPYALAAAGQAAAVAKLLEEGAVVVSVPSSVKGELETFTLLHAAAWGGTESNVSLRVP